MFGFMLWLVLLFLCWPLALLALVLYPLFWLITLPFRLIGIGVDGLFEVLRAIVMLPALGGKLPAMILTSVDLPAPLSPIRPTTSPGLSDRDTSLSAWMAPKCLETPVSSRMAMGLCDSRKRSTQDKGALRAPLL